jgi:hypothetical protein
VHAAGLAATQQAVQRRAPQPRLLVLRRLGAHSSLRALMMMMTMTTTTAGRKAWRPSRLQLRLLRWFQPDSIILNHI